MDVSVAGGTERGSICLAKKGCRGTLAGLTNPHTLMTRSHQICCKYADVTVCAQIGGICPAVYGGGGKITAGNYKVGRESTGPQLQCSCWGRIYSFHLYGKNIASVLSYPWRSGPFILYFSDGTFIVLKENLGQILVERGALDQKSMF